MPQLILKKGRTWTLKVRHIVGGVRLTLVSNDDGREFGGTADLALNEKEWNRLGKWVELCRAEEEL